MAGSLVTKHARRVHHSVEQESPAHSFIAASWRRSMLHHGLAPDQNGRPTRLSARELAERRQRNDLLRHLAKPILERLFRTVGDSGCCVVLCDADCVMLDVLANASDLDDLKDWRISPGAMWDEALQGTNGMGTCRAEERPVLVFKDDHFNAAHIGVSCMGAPIFDTEGRLLGVLDVSSARSDLDRAYARVLTTLVANTAAQIETEFFRASFDGAHITVAEGYSDFGTPLLASDRDDLVIGANRAARRLLGLKDGFQARPLPIADLMSAPGRTGDLQAAERRALRRATAQAGGNHTQAAKDLGVSRATFYRLIKKHGLSS